MSKTDIQKEIENTISQLVILNKASAQKEETSSELALSHKQFEELSDRLVSEFKDIEKLEGLSTRAIFHKILGNKEQQLEKERQEYLAISLKHEDLRTHIEALEYEVNLLDAKIKSKENLQSKLQQLKIQREKEIINTNPQLRSALVKISNELESNYMIFKELEEAWEAGQVCDQLVRQIISQLMEVKNWGQFGGGHRSSRRHRVRRVGIDRARNLSFQIQHQLQLFDRELRDIDLKLEVGLDSQQFSQFTTFFFNNIITDWIINQKIVLALESVRQTQNEVNHIMKVIENKSQHTEEAIRNLREQKEQILLE